MIGIILVALWLSLMLWLLMVSPLIFCIVALMAITATAVAWNET